MPISTLCTRVAAPLVVVWHGIELLQQQHKHKIHTNKHATHENMRCEKNRALALRHGARQLDVSVFLRQHTFVFVTILEYATRIVCISEARVCVSFKLKRVFFHGVCVVCVHILLVM